MLKGININKRIFKNILIERQNLYFGPEIDKNTRFNP